MAPITADPLSVRGGLGNNKKLISSPSRSFEQATLDTTASTTDEDSAYPKRGNEITHEVQLRILGLAGIMVERHHCRDVSKEKMSPAPPENLRAAISLRELGSGAEGIFGRLEWSKTLKAVEGSDEEKAKVVADGIERSLTINDDRSSRYLAVWDSSPESDSSHFTFEAKLKLDSDSKVTRKSYELILSLVNSTTKDKNFVVVPIGSAILSIHGKTDQTILDLSLDNVLPSESHPIELVPNPNWQKKKNLKESPPKDNGLEGDNKKKGFRLFKGKNKKESKNPVIIQEEEVCEDSPVEDYSSAYSVDATGDAALRLDICVKETGLVRETSDLQLQTRGRGLIQARRSTSTIQRQVCSDARDSETPIEEAMNEATCPGTQDQTNSKNPFFSFDVEWKADWPQLDWTMKPDERVASEEKSNKESKGGSSQVKRGVGEESVERLLSWDASSIHTFETREDKSISYHEKELQQLKMSKDKEAAVDVDQDSAQKEHHITPTGRRSVTNEGVERILSWDQSTSKDETSVGPEKLQRVRSSQSQLSAGERTHGSISSKLSQIKARRSKRRQKDDSSTAGAEKNESIEKILSWDDSSALTSQSNLTQGSHGNHSVARNHVDDPLPVVEEIDSPSCGSTYSHEKQPAQSEAEEESSKEKILTEVKSNKIDNETRPDNNRAFPTRDASQQLERECLSTDSSLSLSSPPSAGEEEPKSSASMVPDETISNTAIIQNSEHCKDVPKHESIEYTFSQAVEAVASGGDVGNVQEAKTKEKPVKSTVSEKGAPNEPPEACESSDIKVNRSALVGRLLRRKTKSTRNERVSKLVAGSIVSGSGVGSEFSSPFSEYDDEDDDDESVISSEEEEDSYVSGALTGSMVSGSHISDGFTESVVSGSYISEGVASSMVSESYASTAVSESVASMSRRVALTAINEGVELTRNTTASPTGDQSMKRGGSTIIAGNKITGNENTHNESKTLDDPTADKEGGLVITLKDKKEQMDKQPKVMKQQKKTATSFFSCGAGDEISWMDTLDDDSTMVTRTTIETFNQQATNGFFGICAPRAMADLGDAVIDETIELENWLQKNREKLAKKNGDNASIQSLDFMDYDMRRSILKRNVDPQKLKAKFAEAKKKEKKKTFSQLLYDAFTCQTHINLDQEREIHMEEVEYDGNIPM